MFFHILHHLHAARPPLNGIPHCQQTAFAILPPLMIPETKSLNTLLREKFLSRRIALNCLRQTVLKAVKFDIQLGVGAIEIQNMPADRVLAAEFEAGEAAPAQCPP